MATKQNTKTRTSRQGRNNGGTRVPAQRTAEKAPPKWVVGPKERADMMALVKEAKKASGQARFLQARATGVVFRLGAIGKGRQWETQGDYALELGVSGSTVTHLKTLAVLIERKGLTADSPEWGVISDKVGAKPVAAAIREGKGIRAVAALARAEKKAPTGGNGNGNGSGNGGAQAPRKTAAEKAAEKKAEREAAVKAGASGWKTVQAALAVVRESRESLTESQRRAVLASLATLSDEYGASVKNGGKADETPETPETEEATA